MVDEIKIAMVAEASSPEFAQQSSNSKEEFIWVEYERN